MRLLRRPHLSEYLGEDGVLAASTGRQDALQQLPASRRPCTNDAVLQLQEGTFSRSTGRRCNPRVQPLPKCTICRRHMGSQLEPTELNSSVDHWFVWCCVSGLLRRYLLILNFRVATTVATLRTFASGLASMRRALPAVARVSAWSATTA